MDHPYSDLPDRSFWRRAVAGVTAADVDPVGEFTLKIDARTRVATAGSCFAQHIARHLKASGYNYYVGEAGHPILPERARMESGYGLYSCRYGNIYTTRQLRQLFERAYGRFKPQEDVWFKRAHVVVDPFRPSAQPGGFISETEMRRDREQHLAAVRKMFETLNVFIFTLGLTECWRSRLDGAVFPVCPGVDGGEFNPEVHEFYNQSVDDVIGDLRTFRAYLAKTNPTAQIVLTVSPVPLVATAQANEHVLSATTYSKAVLRVAAETLRRRFANVHYFPSFEIITGNFNRGRYYADDFRNVTESGVQHVMRTFMRHAAQPLGGQPAPLRPEVDESDDYLKTSERVIDVECDEVALDRS